MSVRVLVGHVLDRLRELPDESVHCCVTSPPYYGLRDYGIEPQVWGGDPGCEHGWGAHGALASERLCCRQRRRPAPDVAARRTAKTARHRRRPFCRHCNAWRGSLGLEPTLDLYLDHMVEIFRELRRVLRKDGTCWLNIGDSYSSDVRSGAATAEQSRTGLDPR